MIKRQQVLTTLVAMGMFNGTPMGEIRRPRYKKECLQCKKPHNHNNSWCSPECKKEYDN